MGAELFGEGFVGGFEGFEVDGNGVAAFILGFEGHADLIPAYIGTVQLKFVANLVVERLFEIGLPNFATFVKDGLGFGTKNFPFHVANHEIAFEAVRRTDFGFSIGDEVVYDVPLSAVPFQAVCTCGEIRAVEEHIDQTIVLEFFGKFCVGLKELVSVIKPSMFY